jgi:hypothetical protein
MSLRVLQTPKRVIMVAFLPLALGGCACFAPVVRTIQTALVPDRGWAAVTTAADQPIRPHSRARVRHKAVKGWRHDARVAKASLRSEHAPTVPARPAPEAAPKLPDEANPQALAAQAERLAAAEKAAAAADEQVVKEADALMQQGKVLAARKRLVAAMNGSNAPVIFAFARTYDPDEIAALSRADAPADTRRAKALYDHARLLGSKEAVAALKRLESLPDSKAAPAKP